MTRGPPSATGGVSGASPGDRPDDAQAEGAAAGRAHTIGVQPPEPGLLGKLLEGGTCDQRLTITPSPRPGHYMTWEPYRQTIETTDGTPVAERRWRPE